MKFERLNSRTGGAFAAAAYIMLGVAVSWKAWRTGSLADMAMGILLFVCAGIAFMIFKRNEDGGPMRFSMMHLLIAMTVMSFAITLLLFDT